MTLADWESRNKWLILHTTTRQEIADLLAVVDRDLRESDTPGLGADWRLAIAHNAALQAAAAALAASGYKAGRGDYHHRTIESLRLTIGWDAARVEALQGFRRKRNTTEYDRAGLVSDQDAAEIRQLEETLRDDVRTWLRKTHPELL